MDVQLPFTSGPAIGLRGTTRKEDPVNIFALIIVIIAVILLITGGLVESLNFLLWVGIVLAVIAVVMFLLRSITGRR